MIHQYKLGGLNIVLDICSGSVHVVDEVAYDMIAAYADTPRDELIAAMMAKYGHREDVTEEEIRAAEKEANLSNRQRKKQQKPQAASKPTSMVSARTREIIFFILFPPRKQKWTASPTGKRYSIPIHNFSILESGSSTTSQNYGNH